MEPRNCFHNTELLGTTHSRAPRTHPTYSARTHFLTQMIENIEMMLVNNANNICTFSSLRQWIFRVLSFFSRSLLFFTHNNIIFIIYFSTHPSSSSSSFVLCRVRRSFPRCCLTLFICHNFRFDCYANAHL